MLKSLKLFKFGKSKSKKLAKSKKLIKNINLPNFGIIKTRLRFLTPDIKITFNYL